MMGSYECRCREGFLLSDNQHTCIQRPKGGAQKLYRMCCPLTYRGLSTVLGNWSTVRPWICVTTATRKVKTVSRCLWHSKSHACQRQRCYFALVLSVAHRAPWVHNPAVKMTLLSGAFIASELAQWWQPTLSSLSDLHTWTQPVTLKRDFGQLCMKIHIQGEVTTLKTKTNEFFSAWRAVLSLSWRQKPGLPLALRLHSLKCSCSRPLYHLTQWFFCLLVSYCNSSP